MRFAQVTLIFRSRLKRGIEQCRITLPLNCPFFLCCVSTEEPSERQRPQEHAAVQHADTAKECQAEREVRASHTSILHLFLECVNVLLINNLSYCNKIHKAPSKAVQDILHFADVCSIRHGFEPAI